MSAKTTLISKLHELELLAEHCEDQDAIYTVNKHLQVAITVIKPIAQYPSKTFLLVKRKVSPNENSAHQRRFFSTEKTTVTMTMSKPNQSQLDIAKKMLKIEDTKFCGSCLKDDHGYNLETVQ